MPGKNAVVRATERMLTDDKGTCLANVYGDGDRIAFEIGRECALDQLDAMLPQIGAYSVAMLDTLFRGRIRIERKDSTVTLTSGDIGFSKGTLKVYSEDARGVRTMLFSRNVNANIGPHTAIASRAADLSAARVVAFFRGQDAHGQPILATGISAKRQR